MKNSNDILLIDRDNNFLAYLIGVLQTAGYTVHTAMEMRGALSALAKHPIGLIISGKELQDTSGNNFLRFIKSDPLREKIPVMFLVSVKDQGRPFAAFKLGAADYLVYPIESEILIGRIDEVFKQASREGSSRSKEISGSSQEEKPQGKAESPLNLKIDISRDGVIWLPGIVQSFSKDSLFLKTSLFGKPGVRLMLRFKLSDGLFVANCHIKDMSFDDFQKPTGISVSVEDDSAWRRINADLITNTEREPSDSKIAVKDADTDEFSSGDSQNTDAAQQPEEDSRSISGTQLLQAAEKKKDSYDLRFYYSLIGKQMDNYRAITLIGAGTMGGVLQGWDVALEREVALKIISYELSTKQQFRDLFIKEARVVSRLNHPNIAQIYSIGSSNDILYYAMEFIDGETLKDVLNREGRLNSLKGLRYLLTICEALDFVYRSGIVHRDIKPANIMINNMGILKLVDFGLANVHGSEISGRDKKMIMGTPLYMSPEQIVGLTLDHRSDMYSLGATFYHALCGEPPFKSEDFKEILDQHLNSPLIPLEERHSKTAPALCKIIDKMLSKDPNDRYNEFQDIITELKKLNSRISAAKRASK
jgi:DNA-binding response OmpR family regulator/predicted Ser/Thr protein kinase